MVSPLGLPGRNIFAGLRPLRDSERLFDRAMERLATGKLVNHGSDGPAALIAGQHLSAAIRTLEAESRAIERESLRLAAEDGALAAVGDMTSELQGLAVQAANTAGMTDAERQALEIEAASIVRAIEHSAAGSTFAGEPIFEGTLTDELGALEAEAGGGDPVSYTLADVGRGLSLLDDPAMIEQIADAATKDIATMRGEIGARIADEIEPRSRAIDTAMVNLAKAHSIIIDADYARETANFMRADVLGQASRYLIALDSKNASLAVSLLGLAA